MDMQSSAHTAAGDLPGWGFALRCHRDAAGAQRVPAPAPRLGKRGAQATPVRPGRGRTALRPQLRSAEAVSPEPGQRSCSANGAALSSAREKKKTEFPAVSGALVKSEQVRSVAAAVMSRSQAWAVRWHRCAERV